LDNFSYGKRVAGEVLGTAIIPQPLALAVA
jgi:hypothetical protein